MATDNIEIVRSIYAALGRRDMDEVFSLAHDDFKLDCAPDALPVGGTYHGREGLGRFLVKAAELHADLRVESEVLIDAGETVIVLVHLTGKGSGGPLDARSIHLWQVHDGKARSLREYPDISRVLPSIGKPAVDRPVIYSTTDRVSA